MIILALRPTTTGAVIRSSGNVPGLMMSQAEIDSGAREVFANTLRYVSGVGDELKWASIYDVRTEGGGGGSKNTPN